MEGQLGDGILRAQVVVEGGPVWAVEAVVQVIGPWAVLIAWPEVDPGLPLCFNPGHIAQLSINLWQGGGREDDGPNSWELKPGERSPGSLLQGERSPLGLVPSESSWQCSSPHPIACPALSPNNSHRRGPL